MEDIVLKIHKNKGFVGSIVVCNSVVNMRCKQNHTPCLKLEKLTLSTQYFS
jgi:hypothetical protein